jgi:hypothetical protein
MSLPTTIEVTGRLPADEVLRRLTVAVRDRRPIGEPDLYGYYRLLEGIVSPARISLRVVRRLDAKPQPRNLTLLAIEGAFIQRGESSGIQARALLVGHGLWLTLRYFFIAVGSLLFVALFLSNAGGPGFETPAAAASEIIVCVGCALAGEYVYRNQMRTASRDLAMVRRLFEDVVEPIRPAAPDS